MSVYKQKGSKNWWYKFNWHGEPIRESTRQANKRVAEAMEAADKTRRAMSAVGIKARAQAPTVADFLYQRFLPHISATKADKPNTVSFYQACSGNLAADKQVSGLRLDAIKAEHVTGFIQRRRATGKKISTINRDLATLKRALRLAVEWEVIYALPLVKLLSGEATRDKVLSSGEETRYLAHADGTLHATGLLMLDCGLRPEECHRLRWESNISGGFIEIHKGKRDGSRRRIEMTDRVREILASTRQASGWVFPAPTRSGHIETSSHRKQHAAAVQEAGLPVFVPYSLRHTCLTRWARTGMDPFTLKYLAGHKSIATTMRYIHLAGADAQDRLREARSKMDQGGHSSGHSGERGTYGKKKK